MGSLRILVSLLIFLLILVSTIPPLPLPQTGMCRYICAFVRMHVCVFVVCFQPRLHYSTIHHLSRSNTSTLSPTSSIDKVTCRVQSRFKRKKNHFYKFECDVCTYGTDNVGRMKQHQVGIHGKSKRSLKNMSEYKTPPLQVPPRPAKGEEPYSAHSGRATGRKRSGSRAPYGHEEYHPSYGAGPSEFQDARGRTQYRRRAPKGHFKRKVGYKYRKECDKCDYGTDDSGNMRKHQRLHDRAAIFQR
jgi:hypothetical protein